VIKLTCLFIASTNAWFDSSLNTFKTRLMSSSEIDRWWLIVLCRLIPVPYLIIELSFIKELSSWGVSSVSITVRFLGKTIYLNWSRIKCICFLHYWNVKLISSGYRMTQLRWLPFSSFLNISLNLRIRAWLAYVRNSSFKLRSSWVKS
jgi:hypothetical protein